MRLRYDNEQPVLPLVVIDKDGYTSYIVSIYLEDETMVSIAKMFCSNFPSASTIKCNSDEERDKIVADIITAFKAGGYETTVSLD